VISGWLAVLLLSSACTSPPAASPAPTVSSSSGPATAYASYVALGDSYTAGPFITTTDVAGGCFRSDHNYPSLLAERLGVRKFRDVSCSGATTHDIARRQRLFRGGRAPAQLRAVRPGTDLVTLGIGGNDFDLFQTLAGTCTALRSSDPTGAPCTARLRGAKPGPHVVLRRVQARVARVLRAIQRRAPHAAVVLVGYLRLAPTTGTCPARLPLADGDYAWANRMSRALSRTMARAARAAGARFVDMYRASAGHDVCSRHPWTNGRKTVQGKAFAYHPVVAGMRAVAARIAAALPTGG
jgi:lysophospholipase L1-like esterase